MGRVKRLGEQTELSTIERGSTGIKLSCLYQWIHRGWLDGTFFGNQFTQHHHSYYLFNRERLLQWRNERVVSSEAALLLGIDRAALLSLVRKGKLTPLLGTGTKPYWFLRQDILEWRHKGTCLSTITVQKL